MDEQYPYAGFGDYNYAGNYTGGDTTQSANTKTTSVSDAESTAPSGVAGTLVPGRLFEISLDGGSESEEGDYLSSERGYKIPFVALAHDPHRVSVHPLGVRSFPLGVEKKYWKSLDKDRLYAFDEAKSAPEIPLSDPAVPDVAEKEASSIFPERLRRLVSGGNGSGGGTSDTADKDEERDPTEMPFLDHLEEFRWVILKSIVTIVITMIGSWYLADWFYSQITVLAKNAGIGELVYTKVLETLMLRLQMAFFMGLFIAIPFVFYYIWSFVSPGLYKHEKNWVLPLIFAATGCFFCGAALAWFVMVPYMLKFIISSFALPGTKSMITIGPFVSLIIKFVISFGITFELPVVTFVLAKIGIVKHTFMSKYRGYAVVIIFVISAIVTPTVDPISQTLFAIPLYILYEISILVARFAGRKTVL